MTCPHCAAFHKDVLPKLKENIHRYGQAKYIVREFPLDNVAAAAFMLGRCIDQAKYFDFIDLLYANQEEWAFKDNPIPAYRNSPSRSASPRNASTSASKTRSC